MSPILKFENILNVRDFGGHTTADGRSIKKGKLLRGAQLSKMSDRDETKLQNYDINLVVDLRHKPERERQGSKWPSKNRPNTFVYDDNASAHKDNKLAPHEIFIIRELTDPADARRYMMGSYTDRPNDPGFINVTGKSLKHMAETGDHIYVHCAAGKDRTGTFAAILLLAMGVSKDDVIDEYMLTRKAVDISPILDAAAIKMEQQYGRPFDPDALRPIFGVEPDFLHASLNAMGDIDVYSRNVLGLSTSQIESLKSHYTK